MMLTTLTPQEHPRLERSRLAGMWSDRAASVDMSGSKILFDDADPQH
jgi:hypothetical protein